MEWGERISSSAMLACSHGRSVPKDSGTHSRAGMGRDEARVDGACGRLTRVVEVGLHDGVVLHCRIVLAVSGLCRLWV